MAKFRNVGANPLCLRGGREVQPGEVFAFGEYHRPAGPDGPDETGPELDSDTLEFWFKVGGVASVEDAAVSEIHDEEFHDESNG